VSNTTPGSLQKNTSQVQLVLDSFGIVFVITINAEKSIIMWCAGIASTVIVSYLKLTIINLPPSQQIGTFAKLFQ